MKIKTLPAIVAFCLLSAGGYAQFNVFRVSGGAPTETGEGIFYSLPRSVIEVTVVVEKVENYKGPYSEFALRMLGLKNVVTANTVEYAISSVNIVTGSEPDPDQFFFVTGNKKSMKDAESTILRLDEAGVILGTIGHDAVELKDRKEEQVLQKQTGEEKDVFGDLFKYSADMNIFEKIDTIIRRISIDTMTVERQYLKRTVVEKTPEQKAREAADFISRIKEKRFNLLTGEQEVNYNRETLEYMDTQLSNMEKEYLRLFTGVRLVKKEVYSFRYVPVAEQLNVDVPLFRFDKMRGILDLDENGGKIINLRFHRVGNTYAIQGFLGQAEKLPKIQGLAYRIPEMVKVMIRYGEAVTETRCLVSQLGVVTMLPADKQRVLFHPGTGSIKEIQY